MGKGRLGGRPGQHLVAHDGIAMRIRVDPAAVVVHQLIDFALAHLAQRGECARGDIVDLSIQGTERLGQLRCDR
jgi:hypothetical protein